ncbi:MAG: prolyl oligopeptidase family serine peptidase [Chloroflexota bacterium]|nr:prolyl oligopeptidase family serine peptidase [Chloroflexota bacterium]
MARTVAPYGSWRSPFPIEMLVAGRVGLLESRFDADGKSVLWLESRPEEDGRQVLVRWTPDKAGGTARDISPAGLNVRNRVHEYGGASYLVAGDLVLVSDFVTGRLHRVATDRTSEPITPDGAFRYAHYELDEPRGRIIAVREDHSGPGEAVNTLVSIPLDGSGEVKALASGRTFYSSPRLSPDGTRLAFLAWDHPNLPWDGTELFVAPVAAGGSLGAPKRVAGSAADWIAQPVWSPSGVLHFVAEPEGWMNLQRLVDGRVEPVTRLEAEFAFPDWQFGLRNYAFAPDSTIVAIGRSDGADRLYRIPPGGEPSAFDLPFTEMGDIDVAGDRAVLMGAGPRSFNAVVVIEVRDGTHETIRLSSTADVEPDAISVPEAVEFPTTGGLTAHGLFYRPTNPSFEGPPGQRPPLIVTSHGGPTAQAFGGLTIIAQLFTSRGFAALDVDYGGSTGYGKDYRKRLEGEWGIVDVDDCVNGARWLAERGDVDGERLSIRGGSASGYTTLSTLAFRDVFAAGVSYFGIGDLLAFAKETHKFESRYLDRLLGPLPEATEIYRQRSPNNYAGQIKAAVLILQGLDDRVVPPTEAERIVDALWERRIPHAYIAFEGEDHGFRKAESLIRSFEAELSFLAQVFGFEPADEIEPIEVVNLEAAPRGAATRR